MKAMFDDMLRNIQAEAREFVSCEIERVFCAWPSYLSLMELGLSTSLMINTLDY